MSRDYEDDYDTTNQAGETGDEYGAGPQQPASGGKTGIPGAMMIATGVVNLLVAGFAFFIAVMFHNMPPEEFKKLYEQQNPANRKQLEDAGWTAEDLLNVYVRWGTGVGIAGVIGTIMPIVGGVCMLARKAWGLAVAAALLTAVPLSSPCCLFGLPIGIWALVVLFQPDVRAAFR
jgi:hypothetical protein